MLKKIVYMMGYIMIYYGLTIISNYSNLFKFILQYDELYVVDNTIKYYNKIFMFECNIITITEELI